MNLIEKKVELDSWINSNTENSQSVVELGAGFFNRLSNVHSSVKTKIGIEIWKPYIDNAKYNNCIKIHGNIKMYKYLLDGYNLDTVMIIDVLEHFNKDDAFKLIENLKQDFNKILLMLPAGKFEQDKDITGFEAHDFQKHRSYWYDDDLEKLNFTENVVDKLFHSYGNRLEAGLPTGCYFSIWKKNNN